MVVIITHDDSAVQQDLYKMVMKDLVAASRICPAVEASEYFDPVVNREVTDGVNERGKCFV